MEEVPMVGQLGHPVDRVAGLGDAPAGGSRRSGSRGGARIAIVGAGAVGATIGYACLLRGLSSTLALYDTDGAKAVAQALDLEHGSAFVAPVTVTGSDDVGVCAGADLVVVTAGARQRPGQSRRDLAVANAAMVRAVVPQLLRVAPDAVLLVVSNPCDVLTQVAQDVAGPLGVPASRVFGSGTVLDSARLRSLLAAHCGVAASNVHAYVVGEHGDSSVAVWSVATIGGIPARAWLRTSPHGGPDAANDVDPTDAVLRALADQVRSAAAQIIAGKGATSYAIGLAVAEIARCVLADERRVLPVSSRLVGIGSEPVCLSMPALVGRHGVEQVLDLPLSADERAALQASAAAVLDNLATV